MNSTAPDIRPRTKLIWVVSVALLGGCNPGSGEQEDAPEETLRARVERTLTVLSADSMEGRAAGTEGERRARDYLVSLLESSGIAPGGDDGYLQAVPLIRVTGPQGRTRWTIPADSADLASRSDEDRRTAWNVLGVVPGADPVLRDEIVVVGAHSDHVGIQAPGDGDSIYNGADDDASGTIAAVEIGRALASDPSPPARTVLIALFSAEEIGLLGPRWFLQHPTGPAVTGTLVADLQIEMIGRPDSLAGGVGRGWLTGYERSTMGDLLAAQGSPIVPDPRPQQNFFARSDNFPFALAGIPAHTLSSFNLHGDYHTPNDEIDSIDFDHMTALIEAATEMVRGLSTGPTPDWHPDGQPQAGR